jgi:hypothetical protein
MAILFLGVIDINMPVIEALANDLFACKLGGQYITMNAQGQEIKQEKP